MPPSNKRHIRNAKNLINAVVFNQVNTVYQEIGQLTIIHLSVGEEWYVFPLPQSSLQDKVIIALQSYR